MASVDMMSACDSVMALVDTTKPCKGEFHIDVFKGGRPLCSFGDHNLVVEAGRIRLAELAAGLSTDYISQIGVGDGAETEKDTDTALSNQMLFPLDKASVTGRDARFDFSIDNTQANGLKIHEFGSDDTLVVAEFYYFLTLFECACVGEINDLAAIKHYWNFLIVAKSLAGLLSEHCARLGCKLECLHFV